MGVRFDSVAMLAQLVAFDTSSARSNLPLIRFVEDYLAGWGVQSHLVFDASGEKAALHAIIGPHTEGGVALSSHTDCVPIEGQAWRADPFRLREEHGRLIGRGAVDMKGFCACTLAAVPDFLERGLKRPIHLCLSFDEETSMAGAPLLVASLSRHGPPPALCIVGEPTSLSPVIAHKGYASWDVEVTGLTGHSSLTHRTANALEAAAEAIAWLKREARRLARGASRAAGFDPPWTTVHTGTFAAGTILNIVPDFARFVFEIRSVPGDDAEAILAGLTCWLEAEVLPELRVVAPAAAFRFTRRCHAPALDLPEDHGLATLVRRLTGRNGAARVSYGTEAGIFQQAGIAAIVCGPGDIAQAHQPEEWIAADEMAGCTAMLLRLADELAG